MICLLQELSHFFLPGMSVVNKMIHDSSLTHVYTTPLRRHSGPAASPVESVLTRRCQIWILKWGFKNKAGIYS